MVRIWFEAGQPPFRGAGPPQIDGGQDSKATSKMRVSPRRSCSMDDLQENLSETVPSSEATALAATSSMPVIDCRRRSENGAPGLIWWEPVYSSIRR